MGKNRQKHRTEKTGKRTNKNERQSLTHLQPPLKKEKPIGFPSNLLLDENKKRRKFELCSLVPSAVYAAENFMNTKECEAWIRYAEDVVGFENLCNPQTKEYAFRECGRISINDWDMSHRLYQRLIPIMKQIEQQVAIGGDIILSCPDQHYSPLTCNGNLRIYRYKKNMSFSKHFDGSHAIKNISGANTELTVLVYLSTCDGGATRFYLPNTTSTKKKKKKGKKGKFQDDIGDDDDGSVAFSPKAGAILLHTHGDRCLEHEADPVLEGVKYVLRTDIVYAPQII